MAEKISVRFYNGREIRAVWDSGDNRWYFSVLDIIGAIRGESSHQKCRNYWKYLKAKLKRENSALVGATVRVRLTAADGKRYLSDALDADGAVRLAAEFPGRVSSDFIAWFTRSDDTPDGRSKQKAYSLFGSSLIAGIEVGTAERLRQIHSFLFGGIYSFAGQIRTVDISKGGFLFANAMYLEETLAAVERMPEDSLSDIVKKYVEMNVAHPFLEGNGRSMRIWLDLMLKKNLHRCVDWSRIDKREYLDAMQRSPADDSGIQRLIAGALTDRIDDREVFMKGIDCSYYYEEP